MNLSRGKVMSTVVGSLAGLAGLGVVSVGWLMGGIKTRVWVDGCPDVALPSCPVWWSKTYLFVLPPSIILFCLYCAVRVGRFIYRTKDSTLAQQGLGADAANPGPRRSA